jgi:pimeloyl-ACP methyl ester carboxylesterase
MVALPTKYVELLDIQIAYTECGSGSNLILLHGNSGSKHLFEQYQTHHFTAYHTYALDSRGHGQSRSHDTCLSIEQISHDVIGFCEKLGIGDARVIGYSDGGNIALFLAQKRPDIFKKIVAVSPNYLLSGVTDSSLKLLQGTSNFFKLLRKIGLNTDPWIRRFELMFSDIGLTDDDVRSITTDLRLLCAQHDMIKEEHIAAIHQLVSGSTMQKIMGCNHLTIMNNKATIQDMQTYLMN